MFVVVAARTDLRPTNRWQTAGQIAHWSPQGAGSPYANPTFIGSHWGWQFLTIGSFHEMAARVLVHVRNGNFCGKPTGPHRGWQSLCGAHWYSHGAFFL